MWRKTSKLGNKFLGSIVEQILGGYKSVEDNGVDAEASHNDFVEFLSIPHVLVEDNQQMHY
jgi:hypothetical protein